MEIRPNEFHRSCGSKDVAVNRAGDAAMKFWKIHVKRCFLQTKLCAIIQGFIIQCLSGYYVVFMNTIAAITLTRKINLL